MSGLDLNGAQLILIRHAPVATPGVLCGRTDVAAQVSGPNLARIAPHLAGIGIVVSSPALRCRQTAEALWPHRFGIETDARLWEQDFGDHDGMAFSELPDLGPMTNDQLARHRPPNGESYDDLCSRIAPALSEWASRALSAQAPVALVAHAGTIRAALGLTLGHRPAGLGFEVANLSLTRLRVGPDGPFSVIEANRVLA